MTIKPGWRWRSAFNDTYQQSSVVNITNVDPNLGENEMQVRFTWLVLLVAAAALGLGALVAAVLVWL